MGAGCDDARLRAREGCAMRNENLDLLRRIADEGQGEVRAFVDAVLDLLDDPRPENVERYLVASNELEDFRSGRQPRASRAA